MTTSETSFYFAGGTLRHDAPSYVERQANTDLYEALGRGEFCYILTSRQMGKSSLMVHTASRLRQEGVAVAVLDLTAVGQNLSAEQWYDGLLARLGQALHLEDELEEFWEEPTRLGPLQRWMAALQHVVLRHRRGRVVIFVEETDAVRSLPFSADEFFAAIRECYTRRAEDREFDRLTFCLLGVATPSDLIRDTRITPFNIGRRIELTDFTAAEAAPLAQGLGADARTGEELLKRVLYWTGGHPYLTQCLCRAVAEANASEDNPKSEIRNPKSVDRLCEELFLSPRAQDRDTNLLFVREQLLHSEADAASLLNLYAQVRAGKQVPNHDNNPLVDLLRLSGITRLEEARRPTPYTRGAPRVPTAPPVRAVGQREHPTPSLVVRNRIYARVFDREWVAQHMPDAEVRRQRAAYRRGLWRASISAAVILVVVLGLALAAITQAHLAQEGQQQLRRHLYVAQTNLAQQAWEVGNVGRALELLEAHRPRGNHEDLRGFEWRYLWRACQGDARRTFRGHTEGVDWVRFASDGKTLLTSGEKHTVRLWDVSTGRLIATHKPERPVRSVALSPDGRTLATGGADGTIWLWDLAARRERGSLLGHHGAVAHLAFTRDGKSLASTGRSTVRLWNVATRKESAALPEHERWTDWLGGAVFSPDGKTLAVHGGTDTERLKSVTLWNVVTRQKVATLRAQVGWILAVAFSPDGKTLACGDNDSLIELWDIASRKRMAILKGHRDLVTCVAFSPDGKTLASGSADSTLKLWDLYTRQEVATLRGHRSAVQSLAFSPDGRALASGSADQTVKLWDAAPERTAAIFRRLREGVTRVAFSPDGKLLATGSDDRTVRLWDISTGQVVGRLQGHRGRVWALAFSPDGKLLAIRGLDGRVRLWEAKSRQEVAIPSLRPDGFLSVAFSRDGKILAAGGDHAVWLWDVARRQEVAVLRGVPAAGGPVAFSPDGSTLATGTMGLHAVKLWDVGTWREVASFRPYRSATNVINLEFSPDGKTLAGGSNGYTVALWDTVTRRQVALLPGHAQYVDAVVFSPDGKTLAASGPGGTIKLWNMATREEVASLTGHTAAIWSLAFFPDGSILASGGQDGTVRLWRAPPFAETDAPAGAARFPASR